VSLGVLALGALVSAVAASTASSSGRLNAAIPTSAAGADCSSDTTLCLSEGRFLVDATWTRPDGSSGVAHAVTLTADSGYFWFLDQDNVELAVKTLNGCSVNGRFWLFSAGLTNLQVDIHVTDTTTNQSRTYSNPQGHAFQPITDTSAFSSCPAGGAALGNPEEPPVELPMAPRAISSRQDSAPGCIGSDTVLCLSGRFEVEVSWQTTSRESGVGHAAQLTSESGYFWFFETSNVELIVKELNACGLGQGNWIFVAGMTTAGVQLKVTDTFAGTVRSYDNPLGAAFIPIQDTSAFSFCPTPTPAPTVTETPTPTTTPSSTRTPRPTRTPTMTPTPTITPTPTPFTAHVVLNYCLTPPGTIHIHVGDMVTWHWAYGPGVNQSTTSGACNECSPLSNPFPFLHCLEKCSSCTPDGLWDSGSHVGPRSFSHVFTTTGTFPYYDRIGGSGGTINVIRGFEVVVDP
jgi:plastocyanin